MFPRVSLSIILIHYTVGIIFTQVINYLYHLKAAQIILFLSHIIDDII